MLDTSIMLKEPQLNMPLNTRAARYLAARKDLAGKNVNLTEVSIEGDIPLGWWVWSQQLKLHERRTYRVLEGQGKSMAQIQAFVDTLVVVRAITKAID